MDEPKADIMMKFVLKGGGDITGESNLQKAPGDPFMAGFSPASGYEDFANFFEVSNFNFTIKVEPQEQKGGAMTAATPAVHVTHQKTNLQKTAKSNDPFERWRSATDDELKKITYPVLFDTFSFDRYIDAASPLFFQQCANQESFESACLVKRVMATSGSISLLQSLLGIGGSGGGGDMASAGFLRIDFTDVMLTQLAWNDGDMVTENCSFTCKHVEVRYRKQNMNSSLTDTVSHAVWDRKLNGTPNSGQGS